MKRLIKGKLYYHKSVNKAGPLLYLGEKINDNGIWVHMFLDGEAKILNFGRSFYNSRAFRPV